MACACAVAVFRTGSASITDERAPRLFLLGRGAALLRHARLGLRHQTRDRSGSILVCTLRRQQPGAQERLPYQCAHHPTGSLLHCIPGRLLCSFSCCMPKHHGGMVCCPAHMDPQQQQQWPVSDRGSAVACNFECNHSWNRVSGTQFCAAAHQHQSGRGCFRRLQLRGGSDRAFRVGAACRQACKQAALTSLD